MTHTYQIMGMTCDSCQAKVKKLLEGIQGLTDVNVDWRNNEASVTMKEHISTSTLKGALKTSPKYQLSEKEHVMPMAFIEEQNQRSWLETYKPVLLIFVYITGTILLIQATSGQFHWMHWMDHFMAGFFIL